LQFLQALQFFDPVHVDFILATGSEVDAIELVMVIVNKIIERILFIITYLDYNVRINAHLDYQYLY
jgi:hypothetical protein